MRPSWVIVATLAIAASATDARAQSGMGTFKGYLTAHAGAIAGGDLTNKRLSGGVSVAVHEDSGWGAEIDFGHASDATAGRQVLDVDSYLVNAAWVKPLGLIRPFAGAGAGIMQVNGCNSPCNVPARTYDLGLSAGGGAFLVVSEFAALRADARYFYSSTDHRDLGRPDNFNFWRVSFGVTYLWSALP